ncbi:NUZM, NADH-ubiquinone oxidoreductase 21.3 kDa subunit [Exidia glandulosa HHB12029]|uniref:NUZM, NADH-ubiquinone oxidoreductase 21.3 kDa subunit n=1 Tax=Exidia glandulosa HHB12029 TaxID=1314781 RepID=A0A165JP70_EXIGL|nr:NUZM, NADH-ubiquinone oxidoreductase 21.3 kDa subunit [Exidia glandulosa HHB12029]
MATKKAADHTLYHLAPRGFWKKFRDAVVVNPEISTGLPLPAINRRPQPASRPERYATPATKASDPAQNPYWKRDVRRQYPQLSVINQSSMAQVLLNAPELRAVEAPAEGADAASAKAAAPTDPAVAVSTPAPAAPVALADLTSAISALSAARQTFSETKLPPTPPSSYQRWTLKAGDDIPHDPHAYWPMTLYR